MIDPRKIIVMTKLAMYDKREGDADRRINEYFRHDYVYRQNTWTRFFVFLGGCILLALYWLHQGSVEGINILTFDYKKAAIDAAFFLAVLMTAYSLCGTQIALLEYNKAQKRLENYYALMDELRDDYVPDADEPDDEGGYEDDWDDVPANVPYAARARRTAPVDEEPYR